jgi:curved DNA-binding protein CbpA
MESHPDRGGDAEQFKKVQEAYEKICKERQEQ